MIFTFTYEYKELTKNEKRKTISDQNYKLHVLTKREFILSKTVTFGKRSSMVLKKDQN